MMKLKGYALGEKGNTQTFKHAVLLSKAKYCKYINVTAAY